MSSEEIISSVKNYYSTVLKSSADLKTNACCTLSSYPEHIKKLLSNIHYDVKKSYYGCGLVIPDCLENCRVLDMGCGSGMDVYSISQLVGESGFVIGVDMTDNQLKIANRWKDWHKDKFKYKESNVEFKLGYIELLDELDINDNSLDVVVSNCVVNLSYDKKRVLQQIFRILKNGGEFYFSDVYSSKRIPEELKKDTVLWGECLSGALYWNDFINLSKECGFTDVRLVNFNEISINNDNLQKKVRDIKFYSATYRLFKLDDVLEPDCEDYGQSVIYKGTIENCENSWQLDMHHTFMKGISNRVCGNTWNMLKKSRFEKHFEFIGNFSTHYGIFDGCGKNMPFISTNTIACNKDGSCNKGNSNCC